MTVAHVGHPESFSPQLEQTQELAGPAQSAGRVGPGVLDPDPPFFEDRMIHPQGEGQIPLPHQMADIEVESLADDLESDVTPVAEADEVRERLVDFDMFIHETDQVRLFRANERELSGHRLARPDLPGPMQLLDLPQLEGANSSRIASATSVRVIVPSKSVRTASLEGIEGSPSAPRASRAFAPRVEVRALLLREPIDLDAEAVEFEPRDLQV